MEAVLREVGSSEGADACKPIAEHLRVSEPWLQQLQLVHASSATHQTGIYSAWSWNSSRSLSLPSLSPPGPELARSTPRRWRPDGFRCAVEPALPELRGVDGAWAMPAAFVDAPAVATAMQAKETEGEQQG
jgi:hypothetical protein